MNMYVPSLFHFSEFVKREVEVYFSLQNYSSTSPSYFGEERDLRKFFNLHLFTKFFPMLFTETAVFFWLLR